MHYLKSFLLFILLLPLYTNAQIISTIAGNGTAGYSGDGGPATSAYIYHPRCVAADKHDNIYFSDENFVIRKVDAFGIITTVAGNGTCGYNGDGIPAIYAQLCAPEGITLDNIGNIYFADVGNSIIRKIDTFGIITTIAGTGINGYNGDSVIATTAQINIAANIAVDSIGEIFIADNTNYRIRKVDTFGIITTIAGNGTAGFSGDGGGAISAKITPYAIIIDQYNNIYFTDTANRVRKINAANIITTIAGNGGGGFSGDGGYATATAIDKPLGLTIDMFGNIFIADLGNGRIRKINATGIISTIAGVGGGGFSGDGGYATAALLQFPSGVCVNKAGKIYIADQGNNRIRCIGCDTTLSVQDIKQKQEENLIVAPNPVRNSKAAIILKSNNNEQVKFTIYDVLGRKIKEMESTTNQSIELPLKVPVGIYYLKATTTSEIFTSKIIIE